MNIIHHSVSLSSIVLELKKQNIHISIIQFTGKTKVQNAFIKLQIVSIIPRGSAMLTIPWVGVVTTVHQQ